MSKMVVVRIPADLHEQIISIADAREVVARDALVTVVKAGISRVHALDRYGQAKQTRRKPAKAKRGRK